MKPLIIILAILFFTFVAKAQALRSGDLVFQVSGESNFSKAISESTAKSKIDDFAHVGIIIVENADTCVIEAHPKEGVRIVALKNFLADAPIINFQPGVVVKRLTIDFPTETMINKAKGFLGQDYDWWYLPDNGKMYCSELVCESFLNDKGEKIFPTKPMNFQKEDGTYPQFWVDLFNEIGEEIPQGVEGSNPNDLSRFPCLKEIRRYFKE